MSKVRGIYVKFYHDHSLNMVMENFYLSPNSMLNFRKGYLDLGEIGSRTKKLQAKSKTPGGKHPPPPPPVLIGLRKINKLKE